MDAFAAAADAAVTDSEPCDDGELLEEKLYSNSYLSIRKVEE